MKKYVIGALLAVLFGYHQNRAAADAPGDPLQAEIKSLSLRIDEYINKRMREAGVQPAAPASDAQFFRRVTLDLIGRIPELLELRDGLLDPSNPDSNKRWTWVTRLLEGDLSDGYVNHFANVWRHTLIPSTNDNFQARQFVPSFETWLRDHLRKNDGYDKMVREILTGQPFNNIAFQPNGMVSGPGTTAAFYFANENKPENLAGSTARLFLGVKLECAQCHAHPFAKWTRTQFWEYAAFFGGIAPNRGGLQRVVNNNTGGRQITIPGTKKVVKAKFLSGQEPVWKQGTDSRAVLADWIIAADNPYFAKAAVDAVWQYFFGISLLEPILEQHDDNPITHPELLDELARQFVAHKYDLKFLIRAIVHTQAYQRASEPAGKGSPEELLLFARMPVRGLSPEQIFDSLAQATDYKQPPVQSMVRQPFFNGPRTPRDEFLGKFTSMDKRNERETSILQALFMMNGQFLAQRTKINTKLSTNDLAEYAEKQRNGLAVDINIGLHYISLEDNTPLEQKIEKLYLVVLSRFPRPDEVQRMVRYVQSGAPTRDARQAIADINWALLNSSEFLFNH